MKPVPETVAIPSEVCKQCGIIAPVQMVERAYDYVMGDIGYLILNRDALRMKLVLTALMIAFESDRSPSSRFTAHLPDEEKDFTYIILQQGKNTVVEVDLYRP